MKIIIILFFSCLSVVASDTGVQVASTSTTNAETGAILTQEIFTRDGQTNLIRMTKIQGGVVVNRFQRFYHDGELVAVFAGWPETTSFTTKAGGTPYTVSLDFLPSKDVKFLWIYGRDANGKAFQDAFYPTNGIYYPAPNSDLENRDLK
jgi:hypothetical protein